jgi:hemerythrin-like domain-containing protein
VWLISVGFFAMAVVGFARGFFTFVKDVSVWNVAFASSLVTMNTAQYHSLTQDTFTFVLFVFSMAFSCYLSAMCFLITLGSFKDKTLFKPKLKWGPASFLNLTHEAFRYSILGILKLLNEIKAENLSVVNLLISELKVFFKAYREHSMQEEEVVFPMLRVMFPGLETEASEQHEQSEKLMNLILGHLVVIKNGASATAPSQQVVDSINAIRTHLPSWCHEALEHLRHEESTVLVVIRKYMPIQRQKEAVRRAFEITTTENWSIIVPYLLRNLPVEAWKVRLVRSLVWVGAL